MDRQTQRQTYIHKDRQNDIQKRQTYINKDRHKDRQTQRQTSYSTYTIMYLVLQHYLHFNARNSGKSRI